MTEPDKNHQMAVSPGLFSSGPLLGKIQKAAEGGSELMPSQGS